VAATLQNDEVALAARVTLATLRHGPEKLAAVSATDVTTLLSACALHEQVGLVGPREVLAPLLEREGR